MIPFVDLKSQYLTVQKDIEASVIGVLRSGQYILGPEVSMFEEALARYVGVKHVVSCASGTDALMIALMAKGIGPGDAVFTTPFTFMATAEVIALLGATPVFVDIERDTFNIDAASLERAIVSVRDGLLPSRRQSGVSSKQLNPKGIIPVDLFGLPANYEKIQSIANKHGLLVVEDAAQSLGGKYHGRMAGALAEIGCTSFFPAKPLGCYGDGGAIFTNDDTLADLFRSIRVHGQGQDRYENVRIGITGRLDTIQAAILLAKLKIFPAEIEARQRVAARYGTSLRAANVPVTLPSVSTGYLSAWAQYTLLAENSKKRQELIDKLKKAGIPTAIYYPRPLHLQKAFSNLGYSSGDLPVAEECASRVFSVPMHPYLTDEAIDAIVNAMK